jgi:hypothetical protein
MINCSRISASRIISNIIGSSLSSSSPVGFAPNGVELKAERRKPSGEKNCDIEGIPSLTGVLAHFR